MTLFLTVHHDLQFIICEKKNIAMAHYKLIYGFYVGKGTSIKVVSPCKLYNLEMYGEKSNHYFIGFEYARVGDIYKTPPYTFGNYLEILPSSNIQLPYKIIEKMEKEYPYQKFSRYALLQNVYTSHYAFGFVMYGYWTNETKVLCENNEEVIERLHTVVSPRGDFFFGAILEEFEPLETDDIESNCKVLAEKLCKRYFVNAHLKKVLDAYSNVFDDPPSISFVPIMCHCCT